MDSPLTPSAQAPVRLAVIVSHPIQHFAPWHRETAKLPGIEMKVFFCIEKGSKSYFDKEFGTELKWDIPLLDGYDHEFLPLPVKRHETGFLEIDNPTVGKSLSDFRPDVVQVFGYAYRTMWRVRSWCARKRVPMLLYSDSNASHTPVIWKRALKAVVVRHFYRGVAGALFTGDNNRAYHKRYGIPDDRLFQGCLPIDQRQLRAPVADAGESRRALRDQYGVPQDAFVVVFSGKLSQRKSPAHLLQAVELCERRGKPVWLLIVGDGDQRPALERTVEENKLQSVVLAGFINQSSIGKYYAAADALVAPSFYDPHPLIVPESGSFDLPVIVSDRLGCIGPTDTARPSVNAIVYPWGNITALAEAILKLRDDRDLRSRMAAAAREIANSQDVSVAARQLEYAAQRLRTLGVR